MIFKGERKCPVCGRLGKKVNKKEKIKECPVCGIVFNDFGIIFSNGEEDEEKIIRNN